MKYIRAFFEKGFAIILYWLFFIIYQISDGQDNILWLLIVSSIGCGGSYYIFRIFTRKKKDVT